MLTGKQILEIREHLEKAQNPIFYFDNDADGLCSYILLRKFIDRGKGVAVRSHPDVDESYARRAQELNADYVFVLDRPILGEKFVEEIGKLQLPIVWIDHHEMQDENEKKYENVYLYNPTQNDERSEEPVCYWSYKITDRKEDMWVSLMGCIADHHLPEFADEFAERYSELWKKNVKEPFEAYYQTEIGRLARVLGFALKDSVTHVVQMQNFLIRCKSPADMFLELEMNKPFAKKYREVTKKYDLLIEKAKQTLDSEKKLLFFNYGGDLSISADISNELSFLYKGHVIVVAFSSGPITNMSLRGKNVRDIIEKILPEFENSTGGGHEEAVGARIQTADLERFKSEVEKEIGKK